MNRIKETRELRGISQSKLAEKLRLTQQAISHYENGTRTPDSYTWKQFSDHLQRHVDYLKGETDDPEGWDIWENESGFSKEEIQNEIKRMEQANHTAGFETRSRGGQDLIRQAIKNLKGQGYTNKGIVSHIYESIEDVQSDLPLYFCDDEKECDIPRDQYINLYEISDIEEIKQRIYDDLDPNIFKSINEVIKKALYELKTISDSIKE